MEIIKTKYRSGCPDFNQILSYLNEILDEVQKIKFENHLERCNKCFERVENYANNNSPVD